MSGVRRLLQQEQLNFLLTNRVPRRPLTRFMAWFSRIEQPLVRELSIGAWRLLAGDLDLGEAKKARFRSLHDCFTRELKDGARPLDPAPRVAVSPCDAIVGAAGRIRGSELIQAKGHTYSVDDLLRDPAAAHRYADGCYVTLRLKASMYHRFHAPHDCRLEQVDFVPGDVWNVNPPTLARVAGVYCRNERAVLCTRLEATGDAVTLVAVAAVLVAGIRLHLPEVLFNPRHPGPCTILCDVPLRKGEEVGWFEHGSTIIVFAPAGVELCAGVSQGRRIRMGEPLLRLP